MLGDACGTDVVTSGPPFEIRAVRQQAQSERSFGDTGRLLSCVRTLMLELTAQCIEIRERARCGKGAYRRWKLDKAKLLLLVFRRHGSVFVRCQGRFASSG